MKCKFGTLALTTLVAFSLVTSLACAGGTAALDSAAAADESAAYVIPDGADYVDGELIIVYDTDVVGGSAESGGMHAAAVDALEAELADEGLEVQEELAEATDDTGTIVLASIEDGTSVVDAIAIAESQDGVAYAEPNYVYSLPEGDDADYSDELAIEADDEGADEADASDEDDDAGTAAVPDDPAASVYTTSKAANQYYLYGDLLDEAGIKGANVIDAWDDATCEDSGVVIAVLDTGVNLTHEDLADNLLTDYCYDYYNDTALVATSSFCGDYNGHGTHVSGIACAVANNATGLAGASYNASLIVFKVFNDSASSASCSTSDLIEAYEGLIDLVEDEGLNIRVANMSLGGAGYSESFQSLISEAYELGIITVSAGGNGDDDGNPVLSEYYPSDYDDSFAVTALSSDGTNLEWSNFNEDKDISAPGYLLYSTYKSSDSSYARMSGTSMASPLVSGIIALMCAANPYATNDEILEAITCTASAVDDSDDSYARNSTGYDGTVSGSAGAIDAAAAVEAITGAYITVPDGFTSVARTQSVQLAVAMATGVTSEDITWVWSVADGTGSATIDAATGLLTGTAAGTVTVTATGTGQSTGATFTATRSITVREVTLAEGSQPQASIGYGSSITVTWGVAEADVEGFSVQRAAYGSSTFTTLANVEAASGETSFAYEDESVEQLTVYKYRIVPYGSVDGVAFTGTASDECNGLCVDDISYLESKTDIATVLNAFKVARGDSDGTLIVTVEDDAAAVSVAAAALANVLGGQSVVVSAESLTSDETAALGAYDDIAVLRGFWTTDVWDSDGFLDAYAASDAASWSYWSRASASLVCNAIYTYGVGSWGTTAIIVSSDDEYADDMLSAASLAAALDAPVFAVNSSGTLDSETLSYLSEGGFTQAVIIGDTDAISSKVEANITNQGIATTRIAGSTAYETSELVALYGTEAGVFDGSVYQFASADLSTCLSAAALAGYNDEALLVIDEDAEDVLESCVTQGSADSYTPIVFFDIASALSDDERQRIVDYVQGSTGVDPGTSTDVSLADVTIAAIAAQTYTGEALEPALTLTYDGETLVAGTDYSVAYANNVDVGTASVTVTGLGSYTGSVETSFTIVTAAIAAQTYDEPASQTYTGGALVPDVALANAVTGATLVEGTDYTVGYADADGAAVDEVVDAGTYAVTITGMGNFTGTLELAFVVEQADIASATATSIAAQTYTGAALEPAVGLSFNGAVLTAGTDYTLAYSANTDVGTASVYVTGAGNFGGTLVLTFTIEPAEVAAPSAVTGLVYTGAAQEGVAASALYSVSGGTATDAGEYTATASLLDAANYVWASTGSSADVEVAWSIAQASITSVESAAIAAQTYTSAALVPAVSLSFNGTTLVRGTDYTVGYADADGTAVDEVVDAGTYAVTITGMGNFTGTLELAFVVEQAAQTLAFESEALELHVGATGANALSGAVGDVSYASSDEAVATVAADGTLTALAAGSATVTATATGDANHAAAAASYTLTVTGHSYEAVVTEPTCTEGGSTTYTCSICGDSYTDDYTDATGHTAGDAVVENEVAATCTTDGSYDTVVYCTVCGEELSRESVTVAATGHSFTNYVSNGDATCTADGTKTAACDNGCGTTDTVADEGSALGHTAGDAVVENEVSATCTEGGSYDTVVYCTVCGEELSRETTTVAATGHDYDYESGTWAWADDYSTATYTVVCANDETHTLEIEAEVTSETTEPTCTEDGYTTYTATVTAGDATYTDIKTVAGEEATGHSYDYSDLTWTWSGNCSSAAVSYACTECGDTVSVAAEISIVNVDATCTADAYALYTATAEVNGQSAVSTQTVVDEGSALGHTAGDVVVENEISATCTEGGSYDSVVYCTVCGEEISRETVTVEAAGHTYDEGVVTEPTCTQGGYTTYTCTVCGSSYTSDETEATGHSYDYTQLLWTWTDGFSAASVSYDCTEGDDTVSVEATVTSATTAATCTSAGYTLYTATATVDGKTVTSVQLVAGEAATGHSYAAVVTEPTCTEQGYTTYTCSACGDSYVGDYTDATGHTAGDAVTENEVAATCTEDGSYDSVVYCTVCGEELSRETTTVAATGHMAGEAVVENEVAATCTEDGSYDTVVYCTVCGEELSRETTTVAATGHTAGDAVVENEVAATCTEAGSYDTVVYCTVCGAEMSRTTTTVAATGHSYAVAWSWSDDCSMAIATATCANDSSHVVVEVALASNTEGNTITSSTTAATCTEAGSTVYKATATIDGTTYTGEKTVTIAATGHSYEAVVTGPTCTEQGYTTYTCSVCGDSYVDDYTDALGHTAGDAVVENEVAATCTEDGSYESVVYCTVCGAELSRETVTVAATGHDYDYANGTWAWADDYSTATYTAVCANDEDHTLEIEAEVTSETTAATCTEDGYTTYTATVTADGETYTDVKTVDGEEATGHSYDYDDLTWTWSGNCTSAAVSYACTECGDAVSVDAEITIENVAATCTTDAYALYTATATVDGESVTSTQTVTDEGSATGHAEGEAVVENYAAPTCTEAGSYESVVYCSVCGAELSRESVEVDAIAHSFTDYVSNGDATCTEDGTKTASCDYGCGETDTVADEGSALGHSYAYGEGTWEWAEDLSSATYTVACANDEAHTLSYEADVELAYSYLTATYTASVEAGGTAYEAVATAETVMFYDVDDATSWYYDEVYALVAYGAITGYTDTETGELTGYYGVGDTMTRAQLATVIWRIACPEDYVAYQADYAAANNTYDCDNESGLSDVSDDRYYTAAVNWAVDNGVITGYTSGTYAGTFRPNVSISFQDMCLVIARYAGGSDGSYAAITTSQATSTLSGFQDASKVSSYATAGMAWCVDAGLVSGYTYSSGLYLKPAQTVARERVATVIWRGVEAGLLG